MSTEPGNTPEKRPALTVTTSQQIMVSVLSGAVLAFLLLKAVELANWPPPLVPWSVSIVLVAIGAGVLWYLRSFTSRLEAHRVPSDEAVRALVLGKSMLMTGAVLAGGHLVYVLLWIGQTDIPGPRERVIHGAVTLVTAIGFAVVGGALEKACVVDINDSDGPGQPAAS